MNKRGKAARIKKWFLMALFFLVGVVFILIITSVAEAKRYPFRPLVIISPYGPGGGTDVELRNLNPYLQKYFGQPVIIKAMPGAGTTIGATAAAQAKPDGYTILCNPIPHTIQAQELLKSGTKLETFKYIRGWFEGPMDVIVRADSPYKDFSELIDAARKKSLKAALSGIGSIDHLLTLLLQKHAGLKTLTTVPFGGGGPATAAVIKGEVDFFTGLSTTSVRFVRAGQVRQLAILGPKPLEVLPNTPTIYQLGYKDYPYIAFIRGVSAPPKTPPNRVKILEDVFTKAVDNPGFRAIMKKQGRPVTVYTAEKLQKAALDAVKLAQEYMPVMKKR
jgi:tripartite-type tricarboxylate transporter receptor subunit TctC